MNNKYTVVLNSNYNLEYTFNTSNLQELRKSIKSIPGTTFVHINNKYNLAVDIINNSPFFDKAVIATQIKKEVDKFATNE